MTREPSPAPPSPPSSRPPPLPTVTPVPLPYARAQLRHEDLKAIAGRQRVIVLCFLIYLLGIVANIPLSVMATEAGRFMRMMVLVAAVVATVLVFLLARKIHNTALGVLLGILTLVPVVGLIVIMIVNLQATNILQAHGVKVGLMGAKDL
ncbi:MAG: hypothetical protein ACOC7R_05225 [Planctomycetota bacterium]